MAKLVKCKTCGADVAKSAKVCPQCGAKQKKHTVLGIVLVVIGILLLFAAFGGNDDGPKTVENNDTTSESRENQGQDKQEPEKAVFGVGEHVSLNDVIVTLVGVTESQGENFMTPLDGNVFLLCEFEIENNSNKDIAVSSIMSFQAYVDDYSTSTSLSATVSSDKPQLDGSVAAGRKMNGTIGYEVDQKWNTIEIRFTPDFWSRKDIIFEYTK